MDNVYNNVSYHDYAGYAQSAFSQTLEYLETGKLAEPMKWVSNIFLAVVIALMINFAIVNHMIRGKKAKDSEVLSGMYQHFNMQNPNMILTNTTKVYDPPSSSGGGRGGGGGGGGGHSSGGHRI